MSEQAPEIDYDETEHEAGEPEAISATDYADPDEFPEGVDG